VPAAGDHTAVTDLCVLEVFVGDRLADGDRRAVVEAARRRGAALWDLAPGVMERIADTMSPQGVMAVVSRPTLSVEEVVARAAGRPVLVTAGVADPGNLGTLVRTVEAAGAGGLVVAGEGADPFGPKAARASAGSLLRVPVADGVDLRGALGVLGSAGYRRLGTTAHGGVPYDEVDLRGAVAVVLGNETRGLPPDLGSDLDGWITVPMEGRAESLNVAVAGAVVCFEGARQRRRRRIGRSAADSTR
jgi:TrmH family RNA methyltransferase